MHYWHGPSDLLLVLCFSVKLGLSDALSLKDFSNIFKSCANAAL